MSSTSGLSSISAAASGEEPSLPCAVMLFHSTHCSPPLFPGVVKFPWLKLCRWHLTLTDGLLGKDVQNKPIDIFVSSVQPLLVAAAAAPASAAAQLSID